MRDQEIRERVRRLQIQQQIRNLPLRRQIQTGESFIQNQELWTHRQRTRNRQPLPLSTAELHHRPFDPVHRQSNLVHRASDRFSAERFVFPHD